MSDMPLFDYAESQRHAQAGIALAAENNASLLIEAREIARQLATNGREVTADDVMRAMVARGHNVHCLGNSAGALFAGREWEWTGRRIKSVRIHAHNNEIKVWKRKQQ